MSYCTTVVLFTKRRPTYLGQSGKITPSDVLYYMGTSFHLRQESESLVQLPSAVNAMNLDVLDRTARSLVLLAPGYTLLHANHVGVLALGRRLIILNYCEIVVSRILSFRLEPPFTCFVYCRPFYSRY